MVSSYPQISVATTPTKQAFLYNKWRTLQKITIVHKAECNRCGEPSLQGYIYTTAPTSLAQEPPHKEGWEDCESQNTQKPALETGFSRNGHINKTRKMSMSTDILTWKGENFLRPPTKTKNHRQLMTAGRRINFFRG